MHSTVSEPTHPAQAQVTGLGLQVTLPLFAFTLAGLLLSGFLTLCYLNPTINSIADKTLGSLVARWPAWTKWPFFELMFACVWSIFWLAAAGAASDSPLARIAGYCKGISACDQVNAVVALSW
jgi:hypothetical protein